MESRTDGTHANHKTNQNPERSERVAEAAVLMCCNDFCRPLTSFGALIILLANPGFRDYVAPPRATICRPPGSKIRSPAARQLTIYPLAVQLFQLVTYSL